MAKKEIYSGPVKGIFEPVAFRDYMDFLISSEKHKKSQLISGEAEVVQHGFDRYSVNVFRVYHILPGSLKSKYSFKGGYGDVVVSVNGESPVQIRALEKTILQDAALFNLPVSKTKSKKRVEQRNGLGKVAFVQRR